MATFAVAVPVTPADDGKSLFLAATSADGGAGAPGAAVATEILDDIASSYIAEHNRERANFAAAQESKKAKLMARLAARKQRKSTKAAGPADAGDGEGALPHGWKLIRMPTGGKLFQMANGNTTFDDPRTDGVEDGSESVRAGQIETLSEMLGIDSASASRALEAANWDMRSAMAQYMEYQTAHALAEADRKHNASLAAMEQQAAAKRASAPPSPFMMLRAKCPPGISGGMYFPVDLPDGRRMSIAVPVGCPPGGTVQFKVPRNAPKTAGGAPAGNAVMLTVKIPAGVRPGQKMNISYSGKLIQVIVPLGMMPGQSFKVTVKTAALGGGGGAPPRGPPPPPPPPMAQPGVKTVTVTLPAGLRPGQVFQIRLPVSGQLVKVKVPPNGRAGMKLKIQVRTN